MFKRAVWVTCVAMVALAQEGAKFPETPVGKLAAEWVRAFNTRDLAVKEQFIAAHYGAEELDGKTPAQIAERQMRFHMMTGDIKLYKIESADAGKLTAVMQQSSDNAFVRFSLGLAAGTTDKVGTIDLNLMQTPQEARPARLSDAELVKQLGPQLQQWTAQDNFSGTVLIAKNDQVLFENAYGLADRVTKRANDIDTRFMLGSMNKMFTSVAIAQLVQAGKLKYSDSLAQVLPEYPDKEAAQKITVHHLLTHTSGLGDYFGPQYDAKKADLHSLWDYVPLFAGKPLKFEPGKGWAYSNAGMLVAGLIVEKLSGENYYEYVDRHIFKPAGMEHTAWFKRDEIKSGAATDHALGYTNREGTEWAYNYDTLGYRGTSAGGASSNVRDLLKFHQALLSGRLVSPALVETITTGKVETGRPGDKYAYGFMENAEAGHRWFGHGGGAPGMNADFRIIPDAGYTVIVLSNMDPPVAQRVSDWVMARLQL